MTPITLMFMDLVFLSCIKLMCPLSFLTSGFMPKSSSSSSTSIVISCFIIFSFESWRYGDSLSSFEKESQTFWGFWLLPSNERLSLLPSPWQSSYPCWGSWRSWTLEWSWQGGSAAEDTCLGGTGCSGRPSWGSQSMSSSSCAKMKSSPPS